MTIEQTMRRVQQDIADGAFIMARQRLRGLITTYPQRLDFREQLADLYRREGSLAQAGKWAYLSETRTDEELRAFERVHEGDPWQQMNALAWRGAPDGIAELARERLTALRTAAAKSEGRPVAWDGTLPARRPGWTKRIFCAALDVATYAAGVLLVIGGISFVIEGYQIVATWLGR